MIDTLMALWNRGNGRQGIMVTIAFFVICISISLLLVSIGGSFTSLFPRGNAPGTQKNIVDAANLTATAQSSSFRPVADNTVAIVAPTATTATAAPAATAIPCNPYGQNKTPASQGSTIAKGGNGQTPTATRPRPTPTPVTPTPTVGITPTITPTGTATPTPTPSPTPTIAPTPSPTPTFTPTPTPTITNTPTPTPGVTPTDTPTVGTTPTSTPTPGTTATPDPTPAAAVNPASKAASPHHIVPLKQNGFSGGGGGGGGKGINCSYNNSLADSLGLDNHGSIVAVLEHSLWFILGGSILGTLGFYALVYLRARKRTNK